MTQQWCVAAVIIFIVLLIFMFNTYTTNHLLGNVGVVYDHLARVSALNPVSGNRGGSYLTFWSIDGLKFGILQAVSCWGKSYLARAQTLQRKGSETQIMPVRSLIKLIFKF